MSDENANEVARARANRLYWSSADTVEEIAVELGIGRSALYAAIRPASAAAECPRCGSGLVFANRSARAAGRARCPECGATRLLGEHSHPADRLREPRAAAEAQPRTRKRVPAPARRPAVGQLTSRREWNHALSSVEWSRLLMIGGAATLGIAAGTAVVEIVRARR